jgi:deoxyribonuclease V
VPDPRPRHRWNLPPREARALQEQLARRVRRTARARRWRLVAGLDAAFSRDGSTCIAGVVVYDLREQRVVEERLSRRRVTFPYVPGLLSFREAPALLQAVARLQVTPEVLILDGHGLAHPRRLGIACHVGVWLDGPAVGCAKSRLTGTHAEPGLERGSRTQLRDGAEVIGTVLRTRSGVKPVYVSVGHRISLRGAEELVLACGAGYRLPEPTRLAHQLVTRARLR